MYNYFEVKFMNNDSYIRFDIDNLYDDLYSFYFFSVAQMKINICLNGLQ